MLKKLYIKNFALIRELEFCPQPGLNIITGETGAGKSIIINALGLILGQRADAEFLRYGENKLIVEAYFDNTELFSGFLKSNDLEDHGDELVIRREITDNGKNRVFINDTPVKLNILQELGDLLIDFHGQHAHQSLFNKDLHLEILDRFGNVDSTEYRQLFQNYQSLTAELKELRQKEKQKREELELSSYHYKEITDINPQIGEDKEIDHELTIMEGIEEFKKSAANIDALVYDDETGLLQYANKLKNEFSRILKFKKDLEQFGEDIDNSIISFKEFANQASLAAASAEFDEERYAELSDRLNKIKILKKKFGPDLETVLEYAEKLHHILAGGADYESKIYNLDKQHTALYQELLKTARKISEQRKIAADLFCKSINHEFSELGLKSAVLQVIFTNNELPEAVGLESAEFYIRTNVGSGFSSLIKTASGGEISRVMLAIKTIISQKEAVNILVFDEIDTGISGSVADMVGKKIKQLSETKQIFVITHLPVIASRGNNHYRVAKFVKDGQTETMINSLTNEQRVEEIIMMTGGQLNSESARAGALELLTQGAK